MVDIRVGGKDYGSGIKELDLASFDGVLDESGQRLTASGNGASPIVVSKADASPTILDSTSWKDVDTGGSAAARPLDLVVPDVKAGQWVTLTINGYSGSAASGGSVDFVTVVSGAKVNHVGNATAGVTGWVIDNNTIKHLNGSIDYQVQSADIENGAVRFRLQTIRTLGSATTRALLATGGFALRMAARGPFG